VQSLQPLLGTLANCLNFDLSSEERRQAPKIYRYKEWSFYYGEEAHLRGSLSEFGDVATLGITGLAGIKYHPFKNVSVFTELGLGPDYTWSDVEVFGSSGNSGFTILGGLQVGILVKLGK